MAVYRKTRTYAIGSLTAFRVLHAYGDGKQRVVRRTQNKLPGPGK
jgi:hypothetical protein